ncbi:sugar ABC transporter ATP-binding protein [Devosia sp. FKR38]|uniref:sugar ABC transporter ATP-binding protein n=1 Tax=Devosia sp. FKR38 TaxID=2562312 RepID=UPI0010C0B619|nr:sugar ABC transporter ATP-binding protein [Devosia sp. FKR38]
MSSSSSTPSLLSLKGIGKTYGFTTVLEGVDLELARGETIALLGENGAGKSTLSKIITGVIRPDPDGSMALEGVATSLQSPRDALAQGIALIPQELAYVPAMSVADNIMLNRWRSSYGLVTKSATVAAAMAAAKRFDIALGDLRRPMSMLKLAERQIVEIVKALSRNARIIVLDEPTAALSQDESRALFDIVGRLNRDGVGVLYVSHRMDEVSAFSHRVVVLRNGHKVADLVTANTTHDELVTHMLGRQDSKADANSDAPSAQTPTALELGNWHCRGIPSLAGVSLSVRRGEIVGVYGLRGSGAELIAEGLGGAGKEISGNLLIEGKSATIPRSPLAAKSLGIAYVPAERKRDGLVLKLSVGANLVSLILASLSRFGIVRVLAERKKADSLAKRFDVRFRRLDQTVGQLSGGNQQKILLASRMAMSPQYLVLQEPTRGVDIGARGQIHRFLREIARADCPTLLVTADIEEAVDLSDRLLVMREGRIVGELSGPGKTQAAAASLAAGETR